MPFTSLAEVKQANRDAGLHWFDPSTLRCFHSRVSGELYGGMFFVSSERYEDDAPRRYTVRAALPDGHIETVGAFQQYATLGAARRAACGFANDVTMGRPVLTEYGRTIA